MEKLIIGNWGIGVTEQGDFRVYIEYQAMDKTLHNEHDVRLYIDGNFGTTQSKIEYAKVIVQALIRGGE